MNKIKGVIFDKDGTLFDTEKYYMQGWEAAAKDMGFTLTDAIRNAVYGKSGKVQIDNFNAVTKTHDGAEFVDRFMKYAENEMHKQIDLKPGVLELLNYLKSMDMKLACASAGHRYLIHDNLKTTHLLPYFDAIASGYEVPRSKPYPDVFIDAAKRLGLSPESCIVFEDSPAGVLAGKRAGCFTIMVPEMKKTLEAAQNSYDAWFPSMVEAEQFLKKEWN